LTTGAPACGGTATGISTPRPVLAAGDAAGAGGPELGAGAGVTCTGMGGARGIVTGGPGGAGVTGETARGGEATRLGAMTFAGGDPCGASYGRCVIAGAGRIAPVGAIVVAVPPA
jgi:hypothetical protein